MNFFGDGNKKQKKGNPLASLMKPQLMELIAGHEPVGPVGSLNSPPPQPQQQFDPNVFFQAPDQDGPQFNPSKMANPFGQAQTQPPVQQEPPVQVPPSPPIGAKSANPFAPPLGETRNALNEPLKAIDPKNEYFPKGSLDDSQPSGPEQRGIDILGQAPEGPMHEGPPEGSRGEGALDKYMSDQFSGDGGMGKSPDQVALFQATDAVGDLMKQYGKAAQTMEGAKLALKKEFQDTPELDAIIAKTEAELSQTRSNRKQPGIGEFLVMALMNLGGMNPRQSADLVLNLGNQRQDEQNLEGRLAQLEGSRAGAKMQGRQTLRSNQRQDQYQQLQRALQQQETQRKQFNEDRDFGFKKEKLGADKLMQRIGQQTNQMGTEMDPTQKKALRDIIDKLDPYNPKNQKKAPPKDDRQSRMFGDLLGGGGYA